MTPKRFQAQKERICMIAQDVFPGCQVLFSTDDFPRSFSLHISDSTGTQRLCLFAVNTKVETYEDASNEQIEAEFRENAMWWETERTYCKARPCRDATRVETAR
jgi:hypothetical protein